MIITLYATSFSLRCCVLKRVREKIQILRDFGKNCVRGFVTKIEFR